MKNGGRIAAFASGPINNRNKALVVCVIFRKKDLEGVLSCFVKVDGFDSAQKIISMINRSRFNEQIRVIAFNGIAIAGLNVVDVYSIAKKFGVDFAVLTRRKPRKSLLVKAISMKSADSKENAKKIDVVERVSQEKLSRIAGTYMLSSFDCSKELAAYLFESLRAAHIIARGISTGESKGRI